jgi:hypothetical protein
MAVLSILCPRPLEIGQIAPEILEVPQRVLLVDPTDVLFAPCSSAVAIFVGVARFVRRMQATSIFVCIAAVPGVL